VAESQCFIAKIAFRLPYLSTGGYAIEAFLFDGTADKFVALCRSREALILRVQSRHIFQQGLLNIGMRGISLDTLAQEIRPAVRRAGMDAAEAV
jgi:hypothetical protein